MKKNILTLITLALFFCACSNEYKNEVCVIDDSVFSDIEPNCKDAQVLSFRPNSWGNKQIPILISTYFCDFNYPIVQNESCLACIYKRRFDVKNN
ncbi:hypothetical protein [Campylobacter canadensis]|uniref:hypothetical protein n=1 Tax=Campylobacter canadensis TaxID=449520 RepID=UPI001557477E|nr:hypothetical protein [Campylobacter canadensis]